LWYEAESFDQCGYMKNCQQAVRARQPTVGEVRNSMAHNKKVKSDEWQVNDTAKLIAY